MEGDVHVGNPLRPSRVKGHPPGRPGHRPHIRLLRDSRPVATTALLPVRATSDLPGGQDLPLSRTVIGRRQVALRGPFRLRLASACLAGLPPASGETLPAQLTTRAGATGW